MSGTSVMTPPTPVAAPSKRASVACRRLAISASSRPVVGEAARASRRPTRPPRGRAARRPRARCARARAPGRRGSAPTGRRGPAARGSVVSVTQIESSRRPLRRTVCGMDRKWWTLDRRLHGDVHAAARHHDRERRAALDRARPRRRPHRPAVGDRRLRAHARRAAADGRLARRPGRPPARVRDRPRHLHRRLGAVRARRHRRSRSTSRARCRASAARSCSPPRSRCSPRPTSGRDRGTAFGLWGATTGAAVAIGPLVGGVLTEGIGWEAIFFVNVPIGIAAVALTLACVEESKDPDAGGLDIPGTVLFSASLFLLIFGLIRGNAEGWGSPLIVAALAGAVVLLVGVRGRGAPRARSRCSTSRCSARPAFVGASVAAFVLSASMFAMFLYLTLYIQNILGYSALESGVRFMPVTLLSFFVAPDQRQARRAPRRALVHRRRPRARRRRPAADERPAGRRRLDRAAGRLHGRRRRHRDGQPGARHRGGRRRRAAPRRAWPRASTRPSARSASPPASPPGARSSSTSCATSSCATPRAPASAASSSAAARWPTSSPSAAPAAAGNPQLARLGEQAFVDGLNHLLLLAGLLALVGAALCAVLIRPADWPPQAAPAVGVARRLRQRLMLGIPGPARVAAAAANFYDAAVARRPRRPAADARGADRPRAAAQPLPLPAGRAGAAARVRARPRCCSCRRWPRRPSASTCGAAARSPSTCCWPGRRPTSSTTARSSSPTARSASSTGSTR